MNYRSEIDGLRGLSVLIIILFHAEFALFNGGFIGVDIFFVISGYLITSILINDLDKNNFKFTHFFEKRIRRILPTLIFVVIVCLPFAWFLMNPIQLNNFGKSLLAVIFFVSNFFFWKESSYFEIASGEKPLIHTWSLAVEEQYYLFFPFFLFFLWKFGKNKIFIIVIILSALSLFLSEWGWRNRPDANFYLTPTRIWEILFGSIACFISYAKKIKKNEFFSIVGFILVILSIFLFNDDYPHPSILTTIPVVGVVLIILFGAKGTITNKILSNKFFVNIGIISYSAYLLHQPIFTFTKMLFVDLPSYMMFILSVLTLIIARFSYLYIEKPFKNKNFINFKDLIKIILISVLLIISFGLLFITNNGFDKRLSLDQREIISWENYDWKKIYQENNCFLNINQNEKEFSDICHDQYSKTVIWGDSHATSIFIGLKKFIPIDQFTSSGCPPILKTNFYKLPNCRQVNSYIMNIIKEKKYSQVILSADWVSHKSKYKLISNTIKYLKNIGVRDIIIIGGLPQYHPSLPRRIISNKIDINKSDFLIHDQIKIIKKDKEIKNLANKLGVRFISIVDKICDMKKCKIRAGNSETFTPITWDYGHFTLKGSQYVASLIIKEINISN